MINPEDTAVPTEQADQTTDPKALEAAAIAAATAEAEAKAAAEKAEAQAQAAAKADADAKAAAEAKEAAAAQEAARAKLQAEAEAKAEAEQRAAQDAADQAALRARTPMRFSAPNLIGGRIHGFDVGDRLRITDSLRNDRVHQVVAVDRDWLTVRGPVQDEPPTPHALIAYVTGEGGPA